MSVLPLFPLGTVLMPGARLPLRVFEPRYLALMRDLLADTDDPWPFGVIAIRNGYEVGVGEAPELHQIGCEARITEFTRTDDDQCSLVVVGTQRFRLDELDPTSSHPYPVGRVTPLEDRSGSVHRTQTLAARVREALPAYWEALGASGLDPAALAPDPVTLSYQLDRLMVLDTPDRQSLLAAETTEDRLVMALELLRREQSLVSRLGTVPMRPDRSRPNLN